MENQIIQTVVIHLDQLTRDNMAQLSQEGYTIMRDPQLLIFGRAIGDPAVQFPQGSPPDDDDYDDYDDDNGPRWD